MFFSFGSLFLSFLFLASCLIKKVPLLSTSCLLFHPCYQSTAPCCHFLSPQSYFHSCLSSPPSYSPFYFHYFISLRLFFNFIFSLSLLNLRNLLKKEVVSFLLFGQFPYLHFYFSFLNFFVEPFFHLTSPRFLQRPRVLTFAHFPPFFFPISFLHSFSSSSYHLHPHPHPRPFPFPHPPGLRFVSLRVSIIPSFRLPLPLAFFEILIPTSLHSFFSRLCLCYVFCFVLFVFVCLFHCFFFKSYLVCCFFFKFFFYLLDYSVLYLFLDAPSHLYMRSCLSVRPSVRPSVRLSVCPSRVFFEGEKYAFQAHLVPCIRPCYCFFFHPSVLPSIPRYFQTTKKCQFLISMTTIFDMDQEKVKENPNMTSKFKKIKQMIYLEMLH